MTIELRPHQQKAVDAIVSGFAMSKTKAKPIIAQAPTAFGKSYVIAELARRYNSSLILAPTKEIVEQNYDKLIAAGIPRSQIGICSASVGSHNTNRVTIGTIGTVKKFVSSVKDSEVIIIDENDNCPIERSNSEYVSFLNQLNSNKIVGLTASPWRNLVVKRQFEDPKVFCRPLTRIVMTDGDKTRFGKWFWSGGMVYRCGIKELQDGGFLSKINYITQSTDWSFLDRALGRVDYDEQELGLWANLDGNQEIFKRAVEWASKEFKRTLVFAPNIYASQKLCEMTRQMGISCETIDSLNDTKKSREAKLKRFREGTTQILFNVAILTAGYDLPSLDCVIMCRATKSLRLYVQSIGRAIRVDPDNPNKVAQVIDMAGNLGRFGKVEDIIMTQVDAVSAQGWKYKKDVIAYRPLGSAKYKILDRIS